ncbi:haloacid dehalogenase-like hydrolase [Musa troglodytarum]|uniref:Haloacid dehalogenase-like hydrolase n=1 Tax=Musa troglodytarum TaxID=320322 RepID=A0A9E7HB54_9LILI|nr:haloacid dehalogenase-like hydrolase [Musa troglodytarum]
MEAEQEMTRRRVMVTFDVDGTLIRSTGSASNHLHRQAFAHAFLRVFGLQNATIDAVQVAAERLPDMKTEMLKYAREHVEEIGEGLEVLPGVASLLDALSSSNVVIGLVTGNLEEIAWMKMDGLGIRKYFTVPNFGGFGSDHIDRGHLVKIAADRAKELYPEGFDLRVHVGDTPNDIKAAEYGGALAIGVCTGVFTEEELKKSSCGSAIILSDLTDSKTFMNLLGIEG